MGGTTSDAGKSLLTAGICRWLRREGVDVAPFKSQNMSNNSMVCPDGTEIGRAQWVQAMACGVVPSADLNPVLLKPGTDRRSHVVLLGRPAGELRAREWATGRRELARAAFAAFERLADRHDVVIAEGAGSVAEVNLRDGDYTNLGLARAVGLPVVVVGDIDRGGVLAAMYGSWALLDDADRACLAGWIVNKFRGDVDLLRPGLEVVESRTGLPMFGVMPHLSDVWLDGEDALTLGSWQARGAQDAAGRTSEAAGRRRPLRVAVVAFPRLSNATDIDALAAEPGVHVELVAAPRGLAGADLVVLPGSRATLRDLAWLRERGLAEPIVAAARRGVPVLGICGGYQMLADRIRDAAAVEAPAATAATGLGLLPIDVDFEADKHTGVVRGSWRGHPVESYEIHHGVARLHTTVGDPSPLAPPVTGPPTSTDEPLEPFLDGWQRGAVFGTTWHGAFENDDFRRAFLTEIAGRVGREWEPTPGPGFRTLREQMLDRLAEAVTEHLDTAALRRLIGL